MKDLDLLAMATHELRAPITRIQFSLYRLKQEIDNSSIDEIQQNIDLLAKTISDFQYLANLDKNRVKTNKINIRKTIKQSIDSNLEFVHSKNKKVVIELPQKDFIADSDEFLLVSIISNLLINSAKYAKDNSEIHLKCLNNSTNWSLTIEDEGSGMTQNELDQIFTPFFRGEKAKEIGEEGSGLGLAFIQKAVNALSGDISATINNQNGLTFSIKFPI